LNKRKAATSQFWIGEVFIIIKLSIDQWKCNADMMIIGADIARAPGCSLCVSSMQ
jgi:hypothetical protein